MDDELIIGEQDLVENPTPRVPICLVLDTSGSMNGEPINELNEGLEMFFNAIREDEVAKNAAEIAIVTFGGTPRQILDFADIKRQSPPRLEAETTTPMGGGVGLALDLLEDRKEEYSRAGVDYYQPWMVLMTDGKPTDRIDSAVKRTRSLVEARKLTLFPLGIGDNADLKTLAKFSPQRKPLRLKGLNFREFFTWLSQSVAQVSRSNPGEKVELDLEGLEDWAQLEG